MNELAIGVIAFACVFGSAMLGMGIGRVLPEHHLTTDSKDVVRVGTALIGTMAALVMSLLISSAKAAFDRENGELVQNAVRVVELDRALAEYGPETREVRRLLKRTFAARIALLFPSDARRDGEEDTPESVVRGEDLRRQLWQLSPQSDSQRGLRSQALAIDAEMSATRWLLLLQKDEGLPMPLLAALVGWLAVIFGTFGLFAPRNATVVMTLFVCALSASGATFLILELTHPFSGLMKVSSTPLLDALAMLGL